MKKDNNTVTLLTPEGERLIGSREKGIPWNEYPRPRLERDSFICLNGEWDFCTCKRGDVPAFNEKILVPFVPQSVLSGIGREMPMDERLCYRRSFELEKNDASERVILHVGAADQIAEVYLNGKLLGEHRGGYDGFSFDVTDQITEENTLEIFVTDELENGILPYGKQREKRGGMWYTPVSGIWQTVWLERTPSSYIGRLDVTTDSEGADLSVTLNDGRGAEGRVILHLPEEDRILPLKGGRCRVCPENALLWSPENPHLYRITVESGDDRVRSYFGLRELSVRMVNGKKRLCLNGRPYFFHGLLDQGYFSDGIFLPAEPSGYECDVLAAKKLGFNMLRKHIKVEPERFYYDCDRLGMVVFQDMVNNSDYSFFRDTALPTIGLKKKNDKNSHRDPETRAAFLSGMDETVKRLSFHPSVAMWTIFNEGWGQFDHRSVYRRLKEMNDSTFVDSVSGWFTPKKAGELESDVESHHVYFKPVKLPPSEEKPVILSEFGGYSLKVEGHSFNLKDNYGYSTMKTQAELEKALSELYLGQVLPAIREVGLSAAVYTQLTDVEDETNGLLTYDRRVVKVSSEIMQRIAEKLYNEANG